MKQLLLVAFGGALGSILRFLISQWEYLKSQNGFPYSTLTVNLIGCFLIGLGMGLMQRYEIFTNNFRLFFVIGFCGGFTTFSTFGNETLFLLQQNFYFQAIIYVFSSVLFGILLTFLGYLILK